MSEGQRRRDSFVLRIWWEVGQETPNWRGWVQHAASGDAYFFRQLADLLSFIQLRAGLQAPTPFEDSEKLDK